MDEVKILVGFRQITIDKITLLNLLASADSDIASDLWAAIYHNDCRAYSNNIHIKQLNQIILS